MRGMAGPPRSAKTCRESFLGLQAMGGDFYVERMKWNLLFSGLLAGSFLCASPLAAQDSVAAAR